MTVRTLIAKLLETPDLDDEVIVLDESLPEDQESRQIETVDGNVIDLKAK